MNCKRAKREIALQIGGDLDDAQAQKLRMHLAACPECSDYSKEMQVGYDVLRAPAEDDVALHDEKSIWPDVSSVLTTRAQRPQSLQQSLHLTGWLPATAAVAACLLIVASSYFNGFSGSENPVQKLHPVSAQKDSRQSIQRWLNKQQAANRRFPYGQETADPMSLDSAPVRLPSEFDAPREF